MFLKSVRILNFFFYCTMGIFGSVILKLLFLRMGFFALLHHFKTHFKVLFQTHFIRG
ncbi:hypothetical protein HMPREF1420_00472 [Helicobacter pylori GAM264Ai]|nr:hypothetical protein HMPREF1420_00472 [Helicobacter pylori GAM264Ai]